VVDVSNPYAPSEISRFDTWGSANAVVIAGGNVYVADDAGGLVVLGSTVAAQADAGRG
jgi:hypothetical protein